jgi:endonuclease YncB( thermonuclease family)
MSQRSLVTWWYRACCLKKAVEYKDTVEFVPPIKGGVVVKVYDGDTITVATKLLDSGCFSRPAILYRFRVRLRGIDTPEIKGSSDTEKTKAIAARDALSAQIMGKEVDLRNLGNEKYGRILADVYFNGVHMNQWMLDQGYAQAYDGGTKPL